MYSEWMETKRSVVYVCMIASVLFRRWMGWKEDEPRDSFRLFVYLATASKVAGERSYL
ncbi:hypothetical protein LX32DRAFT_642516 [Colletotrichum zoysiae]|uniref:Uncharacterized protein n=1 Tax=Colletotrichum zoysiae TaxID=1216348 RepID=A0AAD9HC42_9PEZI|nr:hypothetical protein LX32DRAFT_642516 [Colletotrichum zoysiae]